MIRIPLLYLHILQHSPLSQQFLMKIPHRPQPMGKIYILYHLYPTCIASGIIYELNHLYPAPSASGKHLLLSLVYTLSLNLATCFFSLEIFFTISLIFKLNATLISPNGCIHFRNSLSLHSLRKNML